MKLKGRFGIVLLIGCLFPLRSAAASADEFWDAEFGVPGVNGVLLAAAAHANGVYVGGGIVSAGESAASNVAKWDGTKWCSLATGVNGTVYALADSSTRLYVGGAFALAGGVDANNIACWDGTNWSALGSGTGGPVFALAVGDGAVYAGGRFRQAGGVLVTNLAKWDGSTWATLGSFAHCIPSSEGGCSEEGAIFALALREKELFVGGDFTAADGSPSDYVARWDGTNWSALGSGLDAAVRALAATSNAVYAGGDFKRAGDLVVNGIAKWNGTAWDALGTGASGSGASVLALALSGNDLFAGGAFIYMDGVYTHGPARWDGMQWSSLGGIFGGAEAVFACDGADLFVGGDFTLAGTTPSTNVALWHIPHALTIRPAADRVALSWPATGSNFVLEAKGSLNQTNWAGVTGIPVVSGDQLTVTNDVNDPSRYYRLRR